MSKPFVIIKLDKDYEIRMNNRASIYFEEVAGVSFINACGSIGDSLSTTILNKMLYAGMKAANPEITLDEVIDLVDEYSSNDEGGSFNLLMQKVMEAVKESNFFRMANRKPESKPKAKK